MFPDVAGSVLPALQIQKSQQLMDLEAARQRKLDADETRQQSAGQYIQGAVNGDPEAAANLARTNPTLFGHVQTLIASKDARKLQAAQENAKWLAGASGAVLEAPPEERATAYAQHLAELKARGIDSGSMPPTYTPAVDAYLRYHLNSGVSADKYLETHLNTPQPMPGGGVPGAPAAPSAPAAIPPAALPKGQQMVSYLTGTHGLSPTAASGVVGGLYQESGFDPGYGFTRPGGDSGTAFGMGQWRGDRAQGLTQFAQTQGKPPTDPQTQLDYLMTEMKGGDMGAQRAYALLQQAKTPEEATSAMMHFFRPAGYTPANPAAGHGYAQRVQYANQLAGAPAPQVAQAPGAPVIPQGGDQPTGNQPGVMPAPPVAPPNDLLRAYVQSKIPGAQLMGIPKTGQPIYDHNGYLHILLPNGQTDWMQSPPKTEQTPSGYRPLPNGNLEAIPGGPADLTRKLGIGVPPELNNAHGDQFRQSEFWQSQPMPLKNNVEGVLDGSIPLSALPKRPGVGADLSMVIGLAKQIDPNWSPNQGAQRQKFEMSLADGNSKNGQAVQAINIAPLHAQDLLKITDAINQQNPQAVQGLINKLKEQFGDANVPDMTAARNLVALEFLRAAVGPGALNQTLEKAFIDSISTANTADQVRRVVAGYTDKLMARAHEMIDTGKEYNEKFPETKIIHPRTQEALDYIKGPRIGAPGTPQGGQPVAPQPSLWDRVFGGTPAPGQNGPAAVRTFNPATGALE